MRRIFCDEVEEGRYRTGNYASMPQDPNGVFDFADGMKIMSSDGCGWEHVSVSFKDRCPTWDEMCKVKDWFFQPNEVVIQYHPAEKDYVNHHPFCLHLWRPLASSIPTPPSILVGPKK